MAITLVNPEGLSAAVKVVPRAAGKYPNIYLGGQRNGAEISDDVTGGVLLNPGSVGFENIIGGNGTATVGTTTPNVVTPGIVADGSIVGGIDNMSGQISDKIVSAHSYSAPHPTLPGGFGHSGIWGGTNHVIGALAGHVGIIGGMNCKVNGSHSFATGNTNTVHGERSAAFGINNVVWAANSIVSGSANTVGAEGVSAGVNAPNSIVAGVGNSLTGPGHAVVTGRSNTVTEGDSRAHGRYAEVINQYEDAYGAGGFSARPGSAQRSTIVTTRQSTDAANGNLTAWVPRGSVWSFEAHVVATDAATQDAAVWKINGAIKCDNTGTAPVIGTPTVELVAADAGAAMWAVGVSTSLSFTGKLAITSTGEAGKTIRWVANIAVTQVKIPAA